MATGPLTEQVAEHLEDAAEVTRQIDTRVVGSFFVGVAVGAAIGFYYGYRFNKEKIRAEAFRKSDEEVDKIREIYAERYRVANDKPALEDVVEEKGYGGHSIRVETPERPTRPPVVVQEPKSKDDGWNYPLEMATREGKRSYVIHQDEFHQNTSEFNQVTYSFYSIDEVLADERDVKVDRPDLIVGLENLEKFGHGADDVDVVYVRNDPLEMEFEICRVNKSYEVEVLGIVSDDEETP
jgi:hypothetical protein